MSNMLKTEVNTQVVKIAHENRTRNMWELKKRGLANQGSSA